MSQITLTPKIASISGQLGDLIFYVRNGKQCVRRAHKTNEPLSSRYRDINEALTRVINN